MLIRYKISDPESAIEQMKIQYGTGTGYISEMLIWGQGFGSVPVIVILGSESRMFKSNRYGKDPDPEFLMKTDPYPDLRE